MSAWEWEGGLVDKSAPAKELLMVILERIGDNIYIYVYTSRVYMYIYLGRIGLLIMIYYLQFANKRIM